jgi:hypothetical protein
MFLGMAVPHAQPARGRGQSPSTNSQLGFFVGKWSEDGQSRASASGGFGKLTGEENCAWFSGGPAVVCRETTQDSTGETDAIYLLSFDAAKRVYSVYGTDNMGTMLSGTGTVENGVWHFTAESRTDAGVITPMRYTFRDGGNGTRAMDIEISTKGVWAKIVGVTYRPSR